MPPPCVKNPYLDTDPCIDDHAYGGRQCNSAGFSPSIGGDVFHVTGLIFMKLRYTVNIITCTFMFKLHSSTLMGAFYSLM